MFVGKDQPHIKECAKALNILYVYDRSYEPYLIYWLFPLQLAFQDAAGQSRSPVGCRLMIMIKIIMMMMMIVMVLSMIMMRYFFCMV